MSIAPLSGIWTQNQNGQSVQAAGATGSSQTYSDWLTNLMSATGNLVGGSSNSLSTATMSDQMQALLVQLQGGATSAPTSTTTAADPTASATSGTTGTGTTQGHHHHHHRDGSVDQNANDLFTDVAADLAGSGAATAGSSSGAGTDDQLSGVQQFAGTLMANVQQALQIYGAAALKGGAAAAVMAAA